VAAHGGASQEQRTTAQASANACVTCGVCDMAQLAQPVKGEVAANGVFCAAVIEVLVAVAVTPAHTQNLLQAVALK